MECDGTRESTSRNQANGSSLFSSQEPTKLRRIAIVFQPRSLPRNGRLSGVDGH